MQYYMYCVKESQLTSAVKPNVFITNLLPFVTLVGLGFFVRSLKFEILAHFLLIIVYGMHLFIL